MTDAGPWGSGPDPKWTLTCSTEVTLSELHQLHQDLQGGGEPGSTHLFGSALWLAWGVA